MFLFSCLLPKWELWTHAKESFQKGWNSLIFIACLSFNSKYCFFPNSSICIYHKIKHTELLSWIVEKIWLIAQTHSLMSNKFRLLDSRHSCSHFVRDKFPPDPSAARQSVRTGLRRQFCAEKLISHGWSRARGRRADLNSSGAATLFSITDRVTCPERLGGSQIAARRRTVWKKRVHASPRHLGVANCGSPAPSLRVLASRPSRIAWTLLRDGRIDFAGESSDAPPSSSKISLPVPPICDFHVARRRKVPPDGRPVLHSRVLHHNTPSNRIHLRRLSNSLFLLCAAFAQLLVVRWRFLLVIIFHIMPLAVLI